MKNPLISIVIPVYNGMKYLEDCLDSVFNQSLDNDKYEVICVNDGSKDDSLKFLEDYKVLNSKENLIIISQENKGHAVARNTGLSAVKGEYVWFVDCDDIIDNDCLKKITKLLYDNQIDYLTIGLRYFNEKEHYSDLEKYMVKSKPTIKKKTNSKICCSGPRIIKTSILIENNIRWNDELTCDDILFLFYVLSYSKKPRYCSQITYFCREVQTSASRIKSQEHYDNMYASAKKLIEIYCREYEIIEDKKIKKSLDLRIRQATQSLLLKAAVTGDKVKIDDSVQWLKQQHLYPYKLIFSHLLFRSNLANTFVNYICFLFPYSRYYKFACKYYTKIWRKLQ